jgi:hypothetical protein
MLRKGGLDESAEVAGGAVLHVKDDADVAVVIDRLAAAQVVCVYCHKTFVSVVFAPDGERGA